MKKPSPKVAYFSIIEEFSLTCPHGPKLKIHVGNWAEKLSVISTLWSLSLSSFLLSSDAHNTHDKFFTTTTETSGNFSKLRHYSTDPKKCSDLCIRPQKSILFDMEFLNLLYCWGLDFSFFDGKRWYPTDFDSFSRIYPFFTNFPYFSPFAVISVLNVTNLSLLLRSSANSCVHRKNYGEWWK